MSLAAEVVRLDVWLASQADRVANGLRWRATDSHCDGLAAAPHCTIQVRGLKKRSRQ